MQLYDIAARVLEATYPNFAVTCFISRRRSFAFRKSSQTRRNDIEKRLLCRESNTSKG